MTTALITPPRWLALGMALLSLTLCCSPTAAAPGLKLHVPSPDWRDQVIYFVMTDRFDDGDPRNNDLGGGEFNPQRADRYQGGDLRGVTRRLDYIRGLGATAVWITPPVANQWIGPNNGHGGYHGYWAEHFMQVDRHLGTLADYQQLSHQLHQRGMYLVQDIVVNHTGNYLGHSGAWSPTDPTANIVRYLDTPPVKGPRQAPFHLNDPRDPAQRDAAIYHWTPDVTDYKDVHQERHFQMSGLDDLNTENPVVLRALRQSYAHWLRTVGVDAFRVDTAFYVPPETFVDFMRSREPGAPGMVAVARATGRRSLHVFGEGFGIDKPMQDTQARKIESYMTDAAGRPVLPGMLNFPLYGALNDAFARGRPSAELGHRIRSLTRLHARPHWMPSFVDNHDVDRFLAGGSQAALKQALLAMFTLPGIPTLYYGTEQAFTEQRASMFAAGWGSGARDHFDRSAPLYGAIAQMAALRREHRLFSRGLPELLRDNPGGPGVLAYVMKHGAQRALVAFNTAEHEVLLDGVALGAGVRLKGVFGLAGRPADRRVGADGQLHLVLPARSGQVWLLDGAGRAGAAAQPQGAPFTVDTLAQPSVGGDFAVSGMAPGVASLRLVVDGDLAHAQLITPQADGRWQATVDTSRHIDAAAEHRLVAVTTDALKGQLRATPAQRFRVERAWAPLADVADPAGDDHGPSGRYVYPVDASFGPRHPMDIQRVQVAGAGGALRLDLTMADLSTVWNPANGFDHVAFTVFVELPGQVGGTHTMPLQNGSLPEGMRWHRRLRVHGWSNALFSPQGAGANHEGTAVTPGASIEVDAPARRVRFTLPAAALGGLQSLSGVRLYINTWDYDGGYRPLSPTPAAWSIGGGDPNTEPKLMDDSVVITLP